MLELLLEQLFAVGEIHELLEELLYALGSLLVFGYAEMLLKVLVDLKFGVGLSL